MCNFLLYWFLFSVITLNSIIILGYSRNLYLTKLDNASKLILMFLLFPMIVIHYIVVFFICLLKGRDDDENHFAG